MSNPELQRELLQTHRDNRNAAKAAADAAEKDDCKCDYNFHNGRFTAFNDCIRELEATMKESE